MKNWMKGAMMTGAMIVASPSLAATTVNLSATNFAASTSTVNLAPGKYAVSLVTDQYTAWSARTPATPNWVDYYQYTIDGVTSLFNPVNYQRFATPSAALAGYSAAGPLVLTFATPTVVTFGIADAPSSFGDNFGGVSLSIAAVPEPATWLTMILGFGVLGGAMRSATRGRRAVVAA